MENCWTLWVKGLVFDWNRLYGENKPRRISLPTYPFARERYWVPVNGITGSIINSTITANELLSPQNTLELAGQRYSPSIPDQDTILSFTISYLVNILSNNLKISPEKLNPEAGFDEFGLDSIIISELNGIMEKIFGPIPSTLFFTYKNIKSLAQYLIKERGENVQLLFQKTNKDDSLPIGKNISHRQNIVPDLEIRHQQPTARRSQNISMVNNDIAIIGISGQYPNAENLEGFWRNLELGKDCIIEIPKDRWDYRKYYNQGNGNKKKSGGMYCKWGSFLSDADKFDPIFFNISPRDAYVMDPHERLFLQTVGACFEDAGYSSKLLENNHTGEGGALIGVFAGVTFNNYQLNYSTEYEKGNFIPVNSQIFSVANRVSYFFNLRGPSLSLDTACSSSLYAIHLACESIKRGECEMAIAGGVNLSLHPSKYMTLCFAQFAASDGRCRAFGEDGDGYVPGEGVGAVLLKPLQKAVEDQDYIYAVIKGTAVNHDGKTYGYSVPNPVAQTEVIKKALEMADINPRTISYIEAHGTGTKLGDPIEITGLSEAFTAYTADKQYCAIGSVKSNIGHLEAAAGISQLTKVILQMKHQKLAPSLIHSARLNPNINFGNTPFYVQQTLADWKQPIIEIAGKKEVYPRRAGISSFGAGGVNVHIIVEEYQTQPGPESQNGEAGQQPVVIVLSAKKETNLHAYAELLKDYLEQKIPNQNEAAKLTNIAYTLQIGREPMPFRLAFTARTSGEIVNKLTLFLNRTANSEQFGLYSRQIIPEKNIPAEIEIANLADLSESIKLEKIAELWVNGAKIDWEKLYPNELPRRMPLPTYPFTKERYWLGGTLAKLPKEQVAGSNWTNGNKKRKCSAKSTGNYHNLNGINEYAGIRAVGGYRTISAKYDSRIIGI